MSHNLSLQSPQFIELPATFYSSVNPEPLNRPYQVAFNLRLTEALGLNEDFQTAPNLACLSGSVERYQPQPPATMYSGYQFGAYTPWLGDEHALLLDDSEDRHGRRQERQLKGAGKTPYPCSTDGRAVLRSSIREYLCSKAMHSLGVPAMRALVLCDSRDPVYRERQETAAVLTRIVSNFICFGYFEYLFYQGREAELKLLANFLTHHRYPDCCTTTSPYAELLHQIGFHTVSLATAWQSASFRHGVSSTDDVSVPGLTINHGPLGFMDVYDRRHVSNHFDGKDYYVYNAQPYIAHWNFSALASRFESLAPEKFINQALEQWPDVFQTTHPHKIRGKFGLQHAESGDGVLTTDPLAALQDSSVDFTLFFRHPARISHVHGDPLSIELENLFSGDVTPASNFWLGLYRRRLRDENSRSAERAGHINHINPLYVLRNHLAEQVTVSV